MDSIMIQRMSQKFKIESPNNDPAVKVEISGLDDVMYSIQEQEILLSKYERFAEDVLLSCAMPEIPRYLLADGDDGIPIANNAHDSLQKLLVRYRKMTAWFRANKIDIDSIVGDNDKVKN